MKKDYVKSEAEVYARLEQALLINASLGERFKKEWAYMKGKYDSELPIPSARDGGQPATRKMLALVRDELKTEIRTLERKLDVRFSGIEARLNDIGGRFAGIEAKLEEMRADFLRTQLAIEEQRSNNQLVLDGLQALWQRQGRLEKS